MIITMLGLLAASSQPLQPSKADVLEALGEQDYVPYTDGGVGILRNEVRLSLGTYSPDVAADSIAAKHGIASADMRRLVRAWVIAQSHRYGGGGDWKSAVREELLALAPRLRENPLALQAFTPAFHTLEIPNIIFNRAHDRGYVRWSTGWAGGTYRLRLIGGKWEFDSISNWIT